MKHHTITAFAVAAAVSVSTGALAEGQLIIGTGGTGGTYYPVGVGIARIVTANTEGLTADAISSGGSTENVRLIGKGEADLGIINGVVGSLAVNGQAEFEGKPQTNLRSLFSLWGNTEHQVILTSEVKTGTVDDIATLEGKYNIGGRISGARTAATLMLGALGHDADSLDLEYLASYSEAVGALQDHRISGANMGAGIPVASVTEAFAAMGPEGVTILEFTDEQLAKIDAAYPGLYYRAEIPAETYPGQEKAVNTAEYANLIAISGNVSDEDAYQFVKAVFEHLDEVHAIHPSAEAIKLETAINGLSVPLHPGAAKYYKERGIEVPAHLIP